MSRWVDHTLGRRTWRPQNQAAILLGLAMVLALIFAGVYLSQVASYVATNREIAAMIEERDRLEFANEQLRVEIAELKTIPRLEARAQQLGFRPATPQEVQYVVIDGYNPYREETVVDLESQDDTAPIVQYDETFSGWLQQQIDSLSWQFEGFGR
ncbi:cell division protein FtsL [Phototrophicus methaneseepsis]|uniref:Cell division protein FtsL n=1 Tax=Phototrophicus methaneseepsis TaxID=2710758 RepID=A0A7S8E7U9_9CHLR|nr:cell division protein FtsL [Phototrophicus methaneseepsis]QPC81932.1 cell division protein FtsL [Phototrophicus methaneseepsis]